jgi:hypothetical protein
MNKLVLFTERGVLSTSEQPQKILGSARIFQPYICSHIGAIAVCGIAASVVFQKEHVAARAC